MPGAPLIHFAHSQDWTPVFDELIFSAFYFDPSIGASALTKSEELGISGATIEPITQATRLVRE